MRIFTKDEKDLCERIAEKERKEIKKGDWLFLQNILCLVVSSNENEIGYIEYAHNELIQYLILTRTKKNKEEFVQTQSKKWFPLWQEHDCLEWLKKTGWKITDFREDWVEGHWTTTIDRQGSYQSNKTWVECKTPLESLLRPVLAVMEN